MTARSLIQLRGAVFAALVLFGSLIAAPIARADQQSGTISVTASVVNAFSLTITDSTADFGTNLSALGQASNTTDSVWNSEVHSSQVIYRWRPTPTGGPSSVATVTSTLPFAVTWSAVESTGTSPNLRVAHADLRGGTGAVECNDSLTPLQLSMIPSFDVGLPLPLLNSSSGGANVPVNGCLFLRVDAADAAGTFESTVTVTLSN